VARRTAMERRRIGSQLGKAIMRVSSSCVIRVSLCARYGDGLV
jgi:hypothetical protein